MAMAERPSTSKARGVCKFYRTSRGCLNGDQCKFLHGRGEVLSPYDKSKTCRYYAAGFCKHDDKCWFRHVRSSTDAVEDTPSAPSQTSRIDLSEGSEEELDDETCTICLEKPTTFGLLDGCSHIFCLKCIRQWRDPEGQSTSILESGNTKNCPCCRVPSHFVTPSSIFYVNEDPRKAETIKSYKASMARTPCKYFRQSSPGTSCPFGRNCFYEHKIPDGWIPTHERNEIDMVFAAIHDWLPETEYEAQESGYSSPDLTVYGPSSEQSFVGRLLGAILTNLDAVLTGSSYALASEEQNREEEDGWASSIALNETLVSPLRTALPLTREFMDNSMLLDISASEDEYVEEISSPQLSSFGSNNRHIVTELRASESGSSSIDDRWIATVDQPTCVNTSSSDTDSTSVQGGIEPGLTNPDTNPDILDTHTRDQDTEIPDNSISGQYTREVIQGTTTDPQRKPENCDEGTPHRQRPRNTQHRRNSTQSFVTDGRGRVVATDDYQYSEATALAFWEPSAPHSALALPTLEDADVC